MAESIKRVELQFREIDTNLDNIASRLDSTFKEKCSTNVNEFLNRIMVSPVLLLQRVSQIQKEFNELTLELREIQKAEQEAAEWIKSSLPTTVQNLTKVQLLSGEQPLVEKSDGVKRLEDLIGVRLIADVIGSQQTDRKEMSEVLPNDQDCDDDFVEADDICEPQVARDCMPQRQENLPSNIRRRMVRDFVEIDEEEYNTLSDFIKQRVKLLEVNTVYRQLWRHFKQEGRSLPLSSSDMFKLGIRVTGRTGQSKLKILQSLKLISLSVKGDVKLV